MFLYYAVVTLHVIVCFILVLVVLLQSGKGADLAGAFGGGGSQTAFGSRGPASFLSKMTTAAAVVFMMTSLGLALISSSTTKTESKSILETTKEAAEPAKKAPAAQQAPVVPTPEQIRKRIEEIEAAKQKEQTAPAAPQSKPAAGPSGSKQPAK
jgi:preprotein translocase subunit SecG